MRRLVQISDLHFGRTNSELLSPLIKSVNAARPDLVAVSGDLTQRARKGQFQAARDFLDRLNAPWIAVPGNHDVPLWNVIRRWTRPHAAYKRWISRELEPVYEDETMVVVGLDTSDPFSWQRGKVLGGQIRRVGALIELEACRRFVVIVAHHPFHHAPEVEKDLMKGAPAALKEWSRRGPHIILSGHLHSWLAEPFIARKGRTQTLQVHAGTGLSTRLRGDPNDFAVLTFQDSSVEVVRMTAEERSAVFHPAGGDIFDMTSQGWKTGARSQAGPRLVRKA